MNLLDILRESEWKPWKWNCKVGKRGNWRGKDGKALIGGECIRKEWEQGDVGAGEEVGGSERDGETSWERT